MGEKLSVGDVVRSTDYGLIEYQGTDEFWGQITLKFIPLSGGEELYLLPEVVEQFI